MSYSPDITEEHSKAINRLAQAVGKPMTKILNSIIEYFLLDVDKEMVCEKSGCAHKTMPCKPSECYFVPGPPQRLEHTKRLSMLFHLLREDVRMLEIEKDKLSEEKLSDESADLTSEVKVEDEVNELKMRIKSVSALVNKKINKNFNSWGVSFGAVGEVLEEDVDQDDPRWIELLKKFDARLKGLVKESLPTPKK